MFAEPYFLTTGRLGLRRYVAADLDALLPVFADPDAARFYPAMQEQPAVARWIDWNLRNYEEHGFGLWALELLENGQFIGDAGITWQTVEGERVLEIGWHVHPAFRSRGLATEAGQACLAFGFDVLRAATLCSIVDPANAASIRVASRVHADRREYPGRSGTMLLFHTQAEQRQPAPPGATT
jgi:RimJ/RimL family protein N-acetyltransferase